ncbi:hypothetical protein CCACVL1_09492 [Corchorus capsularis]|uniref:Uncharacterized protein n=1 Tax=Corchorus capsularis TaxID=210143 RepID=A0A1R3IVX3_COCAP|nr:hypothetical protein CCACVL1_09492 [Corchorus capsularis]
MNKDEKTHEMITKYGSRMYSLLNHETTSNKKENHLCRTHKRRRPVLIPDRPLERSAAVALKEPSRGSRCIRGRRKHPWQGRVGRPFGFENPQKKIPIQNREFRN